MPKKSTTSWLCNLLGCHGNNKQTIVFAWKLDLVKTKKANEHMLEITLTNEQQVKVHIAPVTAAGKPAKVDGAPVWSIVSGGATVTPAADGLSADIVTANEDLSDTTIQVSADADLGSGVEEVKDIILLHTSHANADALGLTADEPTLKP